MRKCNSDCGPFAVNGICVVTLYELGPFAYSYAPSVVEYVRNSEF